NVADMLAGAICGCGGGPLASTTRGASSFKAQNGKSIQWAPKSDMVPPPKSHQRYHRGPGTYTALNGRRGAGPRHKSQSSPRGTGISSFGCSGVQSRSPCAFASSWLCQPQARETQT